MSHNTRTLPHDSEVKTTLEGTVGASALKPFHAGDGFAGDIPSVFIRILNNHATQTIYVEVDGTDATITSVPIAPGKAFVFNAFTFWPKPENISIFGSAAGTPYVIWSQ